jgi:hypothetical protein
MPDIDEEADGQDLAEAYDETNTTEDGFDIADPDMAPDVYNVTAAADDEEDEDQPDDFDPDQVDEAEREEMLEEDDGVDRSRALPDDEADLVPDPAPAPDEALEGAPRGEESLEDARLDERLDRALEATFPASDPFDLRRGN